MSPFSRGGGSPPYMKNWHCNSLSVNIWLCWIQWSQLKKDWCSSIWKNSWQILSSMAWKQSEPTMQCGCNSWTHRHEDGVQEFPGLALSDMWQQSQATAFNWELQETHQRIPQQSYSSHPTDVHLHALQCGKVHSRRKEQPKELHICSYCLVAAKRQCTQQ